MRRTDTWRWISIEMISINVGIGKSQLWDYLIHMVYIIYTFIPILRLEYVSIYENTTNRLSESFHNYGLRFLFFSAN